MDPLNRVAHLAGEQLLPARERPGIRGIRKGLDVGDHGNLGHAGQAGLLEVRGEAVGGVGHERAVEGAGDGKGARASTRLAHELVKLLERLGKARDNRLLGTVEVDGPGVARLRGEAADRLGVELEHRTHGAGVLLGGVGHQLGAAAHETHALLVREGAGKGERRHLAKREAGNGGRPHAVSRKRAGAREVCREHARLRVRRLTQLLCRTGEALGGGAGTHLVRQVEHLTRGRLGVVELLAHARFLGTLARKENGYFTHLVASLSTRSAPSTRSSTMAAAGSRLVTMPAIWPQRKLPCS